MLASALHEMFGVQLYKNNARALLSRILSILNFDRLQHARSVRGVYELIFISDFTPPSTLPFSMLIHTVLTQTPLLSAIMRQGGWEGEFHFETRVWDNDSISQSIKKFNFSTVNRWMELTKREDVQQLLALIVGQQEWQQLNQTTSYLLFIRTYTFVTVAHAYSAVLLHKKQKEKENNLQNEKATKEIIYRV